MSSGRVVPIPVFIDVRDVMESMKCGRAMAYEHMRRAIGRKPGQRGQLRVPVYVWQRYVEITFDPQAGATPPAEPAECPVRITRPRTRRSK